MAQKQVHENVWNRNVRVENDELKAGAVSGGESRASTVPEASV